MASNENKAKRRYHSIIDVTNKKVLIVDTASQVTNYKEIFEIGSPLLIHGKTTTLPASRITKGLPRGLSNATHFRNGRHPGRVPFFGSMENVC